MDEPAENLQSCYPVRKSEILRSKMNSTVRLISSVIA